MSGSSISATSQKAMTSGSPMSGKIGVGVVGDAAASAAGARSPGSAGEARVENSWRGACLAGCDALAMALGGLGDRAPRFISASACVTARTYRIRPHADRPPARRSRSSSACSLIGVVLLQRSEGGGLLGGGSPSGMMSVRGAGDLLTRTTWILGAIFFIISLLLTILAGREKGASSVVDRLKVDAIDPATLQQRSAAAAGRHRPARRPAARAVAAAGADAARQQPLPRPATGRPRAAAQPAPAAGRSGSRNSRAMDSVESTAARVPESRLL